ncbi:MAG TPA: sigma-54-dependent Fis family transcriptional regulator [Thermoanaerobaculia bacterium]|nr:sigma-54-dependent Fis family transcriptional regulator [Thermoanaerobaculia bacterium]
MNETLPDGAAGGELPMLQSLLAIGKRVLAAGGEISQTLALALDGVIELCGAERGMIVLYDGGGEALFEEARNLDRQDITKPEFEVSRTILEKVRREGRPFWSLNALDDPALAATGSVMRLRILSVICLPIHHAGQQLGLVYLDNCSATGVFRPQTRDLAESFADFISLAAHQALERRRLNLRVMELADELRAAYRFEAILGHDPAFLEVLRLVAQVADSDASVLIQGESGTGKELVAKALHHNSRRRDRPFVAVNCGALPETLLEAELFGHQRGAFTGAVADQPGWFEKANGGTLFLDEVGEMSPALQVKLLRVLESGEYARVGSAAVRRADVRVVAATNRDLREMVGEGKMRSDLMYRLDVIRVEMPALRDRPGDILFLARHFLERWAAKYHRERQLSARAERLLLAYDYPGNVRELQNAIQRAVLVSRGPTIEPQDLPDTLRAAAGRRPENAESGFRLAKRRMIEEFERTYICRALEEAGGNISRAAQSAGIDFKNFHVKMRRYRIEPSLYKQKGREPR